MLSTAFPFNRGDHLIHFHSIWLWVARSVSVVHPPSPPLPCPLALAAVISAFGRVRPMCHSQLCAIALISSSFPPAHADQHKIHCSATCFPVSPAHSSGSIFILILEYLLHSDGSMVCIPRFTILSRSPALGSKIDYVRILHSHHTARRLAGTQVACETSQMNNNRKNGQQQACASIFSRPFHFPFYLYQLCAANAQSQ